MRTYLHYSLILFFCTCFGLSTFAQGISMSPTRLFFTGNPGETVSQPVVLNNNSEVDYIFNINTKDWKREEDGNKVYFEPGTLENSNATWISTTESSVSLPAKSTKEIIITMKIPADASTSAVTNSMLFFTQIGKQKDKAELQNGIGIIALFEFGLHVYCTPPNNSTLSLEIMSIEEISDENTTSRKVAIGIENDGNVINDATVELEFTNTETGEEIKLEPINISMLPDTKQIVNFNVPEGLSGTYLGVAIVKMAGTNDLRVGEKTFAF
ncbi:hypothetical protein K8089_02810 [Aequorivita sp. F47161]|uniref:Fn3-like domain-containing protein n=1 Tax=Aequorivita vitellina TaxID=2874475 RepID=A0A9X1QS70_9FLAO|nr:hypothetical protein [Aequorivita vitellina]MCG2417938.1 hypothetical protein [Aequorivita vitellina]